MLYSQVCRGVAIAMADDGRMDVTSEAPDNANTGPSAPAINEAEAIATCTKCDEQMEVSKTMSAGRVGRICKLCYNANRALAEHFKRRGRKQEWDCMPANKKKRLIVENKLGGGIKGQKRDLRIDEQAWSGLSTFLW